jgi:hypothetical protein
MVQFVNRFEKKVPALLTTPSIEPKVLIAVPAIFAAVEASPILPSIKTIPAVGANPDSVILRELATTLQPWLMNAFVTPAPIL